MRGKDNSVEAVKYISYCCQHQHVLIISASAQTSVLSISTLQFSEFGPIPGRSTMIMTATPSNGSDVIINLKIKRAVVRNFECVGFGFRHRIFLKHVHVRGNEDGGKNNNDMRNANNNREKDSRRDKRQPEHQQPTMGGDSSCSWKSVLDGPYLDTRPLMIIELSNNAQKPNMDTEMKNNALWTAQDLHLGNVLLAGECMMHNKAFSRFNLLQYH